MPRIARFSTDYVHVVTRGNGKQTIFESENDRAYFINKMLVLREKEKIVIVAYCLMDNHVHFLLKDEERHLSKFMQRLELSYSRYYNEKYDRVGHLFQNRFFHENIYDTCYLLCVYRYILQNPQKAGLCPAEKYRWSSYHDYDNRDSLTDTTDIVDLLGNIDNFREFMSYNEENSCLDEDGFIKSDEWARATMKRLLNIENGSALQSMDKEKRDEAIRKLKDAGISISKISRYSGISRNIIQRV